MVVGGVQMAPQDGVVQSQQHFIHTVLPFVERKGLKNGAASREQCLWWYNGGGKGVEKKEEQRTIV